MYLLTATYCMTGRKNNFGTLAFTIYLASSPGPPSFQCYTQKSGRACYFRSCVTYVIRVVEG